MIAMPGSHLLPFAGPVQIRMHPIKGINNTIPQAKSFQTPMTSSSFQFTCNFQLKNELCKKSFPRQCDLTRHQRNHTRPFVCQHCPPHKGARFASLKDRERHIASVHDRSKRYVCPETGCHHSRLFAPIDCNIYGFSRKDIWYKHMQYHNSGQEIQAIKKLGIRTMLWDEKLKSWIEGPLEKALRANPAE